MANDFYASEDALKLGIFEGDSNHMLYFNYVPSLDVVEVKIMKGELVEARITIDAHDNQNGRKYEGLLAVEHYFQRIREMIQEKELQNLS